MLKSSLHSHSHLPVTGPAYTYIMYLPSTSSAGRPRARRRSDASRCAKETGARRIMRRREGVLWYGNEMGLCGVQQWPMVANRLP